MSKEKKDEKEFFAEDPTQTSTFEFEWGQDYRKLEAVREKFFQNDEEDYYTLEEKNYEETVKPSEDKKEIPEEQISEQKSKPDPTKTDAEIALEGLDLETENDDTLSSKKNNSKTAFRFSMPKISKPPKKK